MGLDRVSSGGDENGERAFDAPVGGRVFRAGEPNGCAVLSGDLVGAEAGFRKQAVAHRIRESADVSGGLEDLLHGEDGAVESEHVVAFLHGFTPPEVFEVAFEFCAERAVIPAAIESAVEFSSLKNEAAAFAQRYDFLHAGGIGDVFVSHNDAGWGADGSRRARWEQDAIAVCQLVQKPRNHGAEQATAV